MRAFDCMDGDVDLSAPKLLRAKVQFRAIERLFALMPRHSDLRSN